MNASLAEHVARLHRQALMVDAHFDLTYDVANRRERGQRQVIEKRYLKGFQAGGFNLIVSSIFVHNFFLPEMGLRRALDQISGLHEEMDESPGKLALCRTCHEVQSASAAGRLAVMLSLEGADPLQNDLGLLRVFYELGVRGLGLVWSRRNYAADGSRFVRTRAGRPGGLTEFGVRLVEKAEALGLFIDLSHMNDEGFWDVMNIVKKPVIASHSNCRSVATSPRNLTDEQITALAAKGGVIGLNALNSFAHNPPSKATVDHLLDHVDHIIRLTGVRHVGLGLDLCDSFQNFLSLQSVLNTQDVIKGHGRAGQLTAGLIERGYTDDDILLILGGNFMRLFEQILD